ncbi:MAG: hypothetical protein K2N80_02360 [Lachnospiraceae bacterium]|nr:hypothetical protein [Lachnospiraceae bacterium]
MDIKMKIPSIIKYIGSLGVAIVVGMLLLIAVYALPVGNMKANVARSSEIFNYEGIYPQMVNGYKYMQLDNYTDSIMLGAAIYDGAEGTINKAVNNYHPDCVQLSPELALTNYANEVSAYEYFEVPYGRYWHGYLVPLKLLLLFFDYADIRILNFFLQNILLFLVIKLLCRVRMERYVPAFLLTVFVINPLTAAVSLQFSSVYYIILLSAICLLWLTWKGKAAESGINYLFFVTGILTAYLDFLTYPLASFGILLVLYLILNRDAVKIDRIRPLLQKMLLWGFGYGGMWGGKWLAGSILMKGNMFADALNQALVRTSSGGPDKAGFSRLDALARNISVFLKWPFLLIFLIMAGYFLFQFRKLTVHMVRRNAALLLFLLAASLLPVGWTFVMADHSYEHYWFTYKEFSISCFALLSLATYLKTLAWSET